MASKLFVLLSLTIIAGVLAAPVDKPVSTEETTTAGNDDVALIEAIEIIEVPVVIPLGYEATTEAQTEAPKEAIHKVAKRSALRGDNPSNDLLADFENLKLDSGLSSFDGRRIKFLPTWVGK